MKFAGCLIFTKPYQSQLVLPQNTGFLKHVLWKHSTSEAQLIMKIARVKDDVPKWLENRKSEIRPACEVAKDSISINLPAGFLRSLRRCSAS
jgi:hypothetical protein